MTGPSMYDAIVVGGGPAGMSAALWLARYRKRVLMVESDEHRNRWVEQTHGYLGWDPVSPADLITRARDQLLSYDEATVRAGRVEVVRRDEDGTFTVHVGEERLPSRRLVLATGVEDRFPEVGRFFEHYGASVFHCPTCDGYEARDRSVVVFGWSQQVTGFALTLLGWAADVTVVTDGRRFEGDAGHRANLEANGVVVLEEDAVELLGERGGLEGVRFASGRSVGCELAFFSIAHVPRTDLAEQLGCALTEEGCVDVDHEGVTSVEGVFAAGDLTPGLQLVQVAAAKGTAAGVACAQSLPSDGVVTAGG